MQHHRPSAGNVELGGANRQARLSRCRSPQQSARHWALLLVVLMITALVLPTPRRANGLARDLARPVSNGSAVSSAQALAQASSAPLVLSPTFLLNGQIGTPYLQAMSASGGTAPYTFAITYGDLPPGLAFSPDGVLSGTPTMAGEYGFSMTANDAHGATGSQFYGLTIISPIAISPPLLPEGKAGTAYRQSFAASGGIAPYTFTLTTGALPPGLALSPAGLFNGTPTADGYYSFTIGATDAHGIAGSHSYGLYIGLPFAISPSFLPNGSVGTSYSQNLSASGGTAPYIFAVSDGSLPPGLTLSAAGLLSGTPSTPGGFYFWMSATDARGLTSRQPYSISIAEVLLAISPSSLPDGKVGVAYHQRLTAGGGTSPYRFAVSDGVLPPGLSLGVDGRIGGTPTTEGFFGFNVTVNDAQGRTGSAFYFIVIAQVQLVISPTSLPDGKVGVAYRQNLSASGGAAPYAFAAQDALPPGLALRSDGRIVGRPTTAGFFFFHISVTDARGRVDGQFYTLAIAQALVLNPQFFPIGQAGTPYSQTLTATGGKAPYFFAVTDGALPPGLTLSAAGLLSGRPTTPGFFGFAITATDSRGITGSKYYGLSVLTPIAVSPPALLDGRVGTAYQQSIAASGGAAPYTFALSDGALPPGLTLSPAGLLSGTLTADGFDNEYNHTYRFTISATDARGILGRESYSLVVAQAFEISPPFLDPGTIDRPYSVGLSASGGVGPYTFAISEGALPPGLTFSADGRVSGTPTSQGFFVFTISATDTRGRTARRQYFLSIAEPQIAIGPDTLPDGQVGVDYQQQLSASGGTGPYVFFGAGLPSGLVLSPDGLLHGTPTSPGFFAWFNITAIDAQGYRANRGYLLSIAPLSVIPATLPQPSVGVAYSEKLTASGGVGPYIFLVMFGSLPPGLALSRDGTLSGTPTAPGDFAFDIAAIDSRGFNGQQSYFFAVAQPLELGAALPDGAVGTTYSASLSITGGLPPYSFVLMDGSLPPGLTLSDSGTVAGTPTISGVYTFTVMATDLGGRTASHTYTLVIS